MDLSVYFVRGTGKIAESNLQRVILNLNFSFFRHFETENNRYRYQEVFCRLFRTGKLRGQNDITNWSLTIYYYQLTSTSAS